ncbi:MAG TPA: DUF1365 domain-containing protein [Asticcacaulis sp.]|nr:DUF1365 domain-containing protein [Asticcacaulis sp.]
MKDTGAYTGEVVHQRFSPKAHRLSYRIFQVLLDLDRLDDDLAGIRFLSRNRFNLFGFYDRDHGPDQADTQTPLRDRMAAMLRTKGLYEDGDRLFLMAMPRVLGFVFNPISLYFVRRPNGDVRAVVYEVNNTFGDRHSYVLPVQSPAKRIRQHADKRLHVSPFMETRDMTYDFDLMAPDDVFVLNIRLRKIEARTSTDMLFAGFTARHEPLTDAVLWRQFWALPLMTLKVVAGIHWEALKIALKGLGLKPKPPTEKSSVSV